MAGRYLVNFVVIASVLASVHGLKCHEGIDATVSGLPVQFWTERECAGDSKCIRQEVSFSTSASGLKFDTSMQYGACMSSNYADYLDCEQLFGKDSAFDPANLLNMVPGLALSFENSVNQFGKNISYSFAELLSNGSGIASFVDGAFIFYENLGFNLDKAVSLKPSLIKLLTAVFGGDFDAANSAAGRFLQDFSQLDTKNAEFSGAIRSFLTILFVDPTTLQQMAPFIDVAPGLLRSTFPSNWQASLWYDVAIKLMGNVDPQNWKKSVEDMVATIRSSYTIPKDIAQYIDPILDSLPDLARGSKTNPTYVGDWSLELLKKYSEADKATDAFTVTVINFIQVFTGPLPEQYMMTIKWMPGLFYKFFPGKKTIIQDVYTKMTAGLETYHPRSSDSSSASETKLSKMIVNLLQKTGILMLQPQQQQFKGLIVSVSEMFYELMKVDSVDYTKYVDDFATVIDDGIKDMSALNVGTIITDLITKMDGEVPDELKPLLKTIQPLITAASIVPSSPDYTSQILNMMKDIASDYKSSYPDSPFPPLVTRLLDLILGAMTSPTSLASLNLDMQYWNIDLQFAIIKTYNLESDELYQMATKAWPDYHLYMRILKAMDPEDVKQLMKEITKYLSSPPRTTERLVEAIKPSVMKISESIKGLMSEMRQWFAPSTCKFTFCDDADLCNTRELVAAQKAFKRDPTATLAPLTKSAANRVISTSVVLNIATFWIASKIFQ